MKLHKSLKTAANNIAIYTRNGDTMGYLWIVLTLHIQPVAIQLQLLACNMQELDWELF